MRRIGAVAFSLTMLCPSRGHADPAPRLTEPNDVTLNWITPEGCPTTQAVLAQIERSIETAKFNHADIDATVTALGPHRWSVHLKTNVDDARGDRTIEADSCAALADATALVVALAIDSVHDETMAPTPAPTPAPTATKPAESSNDLASAPTPDVELHGVIAITLLGAYGMLPNVGAAPGITVGAIYKHFRGEISGNIWFVQDEAPSPTPANANAPLQLADVAARVCWRSVFHSLEVAPCAGAGYANLAISDQSSTAAWGMARFDLIATWALVQPISIRALAGAAIPFERDLVDVFDNPDGSHIFYRPSSVSAQFAIGVEAHFP